MDFFDLPEAQFFRLLCRLFGPEQVIPRMSVYTVCGGRLPGAVEGLEGGQIQCWAKSNQCLFTILDQDDNPKVVIELGGYGAVEWGLGDDSRANLNSEEEAGCSARTKFSSPSYEKAQGRGTPQSSGGRPTRLPPGAVIDVNQLERQRFLPTFFSPLGIKYITLTTREISELLDPDSHLDLVTCLAAKFGLNLRSEA